MPIHLCPLITSDYMRDVFFKYHKRRVRWRSKATSTKILRVQTLFIGRRQILLASTNTVIFLIMNFPKVCNRRSRDRVVL